MGTRHSFPLRPYAIANLENSKDKDHDVSTARTADVIKLEFVSEFPIHIFMSRCGYGMLIYVLALKQ